LKIKKVILFLSKNKKRENKKEKPRTLTKILLSFSQKYFSPFSKKALLRRGKITIDTETPRIPVTKLVILLAKFNMLILPFEIVEETAVINMRLMF
jgi:hypothetical protein